MTKMAEKSKIADLGTEARPKNGVINT